MTADEPGGTGTICAPSTHDGTLGSAPGTKWLIPMPLPLVP